MVIYWKTCGKYGDLLENIWEIWWFIGKHMGNKRWFMQSVWQTSTNHPIVHFSKIGFSSFRRKKCHSKICHRCLMSRPSSLSSRNDSWTAIPLDHQKKLHVLIQRMYFRFYLAIAWFGPFIKKHCMRRSVHMLSSGTVSLSSRTINVTMNNFYGPKLEMLYISLFLADEI